MRFHSKHSRYFLMGGVAAMLFALCLADANGQNVRAALQSSDNEGAESASDDPADTGDPEVTFAPQEEEDEVETLSPEEQAAALKRRAGEQVGGTPRGRSIILGMHVQEAESGRVRVVDVAAASPAFDAGIREGDEIASFDGFRGENYREWIDGIRKLVTDTPDGQTVSVVVLRDGRRVTANIQTPEAKALEPRLPNLLGQQLANEGQTSQANMPRSGIGALNQPGTPGYISDDDVFINSGGLFRDDALHGTADRAVAQIFRLNGSQSTSPSGTAIPQTGTQAGAAANNRRAPQPGAGVPAARQNQLRPGQATGVAGRIGLAGFQDSADGMVVMVDIGNLPPGSYRVGIEDPSIAMRGGQPAIRSARSDANRGTTPRSVERNQLDQRNRSVDDDGAVNPRRIDQPPRNQRIIPHSPDNSTRPRTDRQPQSTPATGGADQRQGHIEPQSDLIPPTVLAQVVDDGGSTSGSARPVTGQSTQNATSPTGQVNEPATPPTGQVLPPATPPTGRVLPPGAPPTGRVLPSGTTPTGLADPRGAEVTPRGQQNVNDGNVATGGIGSRGLSQLGMLTVDQSGTGRMQQVVEGLRVRDVAGQAIVIYAASNQPPTTVPPNVNTSGTAVRNPTANSQRRTGVDQQDATGQRQIDGREQQQQLATTAGQVAGSGTPVAAGIIQMMAARGAARDGVNQPNASGARGDSNAGAQTPSSRTRPAQSRPVAPGTPQRTTQSPSIEEE